MICIQYPSVLIKVIVTENLVLVNVSLVMKVLLANVPHALMLALVEVPAGQRSTWQTKLD
jgi:hypothetical protein